MEETQILVPGKLTPIGLQLPEDLPFEQWIDGFGKLKQLVDGVHWAIGDALNFGERKYGEAYSQALDETEYSYDTCAHDAWVSARIEFWRRRQNLSHSHHREVAPLEPDDQDEWLQRAIDNGWSRNELRAAIRAYQKALKSPLELPENKYRILYADPPWKYSDELIQGYGAATHHYSTLSTEELCELTVKNLAFEDAALFLWVTSPLLDEAFGIIDAWGFEYKTSFIWDKVRHNYGHYNSVRHEFLLVCTRGSCTPDSSELHDSVIELDRTEVHSQKPEYFRELIDSMYPPNGQRDRIELFARGGLPDHWDGWGNQFQREEASNA